MPIKISKNLPAYEALTKENIFVMDIERAATQDIRPLEIAIVNLMPTKLATETQLLRLLSNSPLQIELELVQMKSHKATHVPDGHMAKFYKTFDDIKDRRFDGMIITGAPVEQMPFEEVEYWDELCRIFEWTKSNVYSTFHICWGAQAGLYYHYGINKYPLPEKLFGVYPHKLERQNMRLFRGFDDVFMAPHSRHTSVKREDIEKCPRLRIAASSDEAGVYAATTRNARQIYIFGHSEYDRDTLEKEYRRDKDAGMPIHVPLNYYPDDDDTKEPLMNWRSYANLLYYNWLNYFVYQETPYDLDKLVPLDEDESY